MKATFTFYIFIILIVVSCSEPHKNSETPEALQPKSSEVGFSYKRGSDNLVDILYAELAKKTPALNDLEKKIDALEESESDSLKSFVNYNTKNNAYYKDGENMAQQVNDSVLKEKIRLMVEKSQANYKTATSVQKNLLKQIDFKNATINDLHILLKISKTLPIIEKYQLKNMPEKKPLTGYIKEMDKVIKLADTLSKK